MEGLILETETESLAAKLKDAQFQAQYHEKIEDMAAELQSLQARIAQLYGRWEELGAIRLGSELRGE